MNSLTAILAALALALPPAAVGVKEMAASEKAQAAAEGEAVPSGLQPQLRQPLSALEQALREPVQRQVRIEQRVILRVSPASERTRAIAAGSLSRQLPPAAFKEEEGDRCVRMGAIHGVRPAPGNRLLLFMRNREVLSAALERACSSEDFYSGFYIERSDDGRLCARRDRLQSRAGSLCEVSRFYRLVAMDE